MKLPIQIKIIKDEKTIVTNYTKVFDITNTETYDELKILINESINRNTIISSKIYKKNIEVIYTDVVTDNNTKCEIKIS